VPRPVAIVVVTAALALAACRSRPSAAELSRLADEARAANAAEVAAHRTPTSDEVGKSLTISGQTRGPTVVLDWAELERRATAHLATTNPHDPSNHDRIVDFRGIVVRDLLAELAPGTAATDVTFVALDGFRSTVDLAGLQKFRVMLAIEADGQPIPRSAAGPIFLVFPYAEAPESRVYEDRYWCFYVTHVIVGAEAPRLAIGDRVLDGAALARLPTTTSDGPVGWKGFWPSGDVRIRGVPLADALRAAMTVVPAGGRLIVRGKAAVHRDPAKPLAIAAEDIERCGFVIVDRWGLDDARIPAQMGGPLALAVTKACADRYGERFWVPFVEELVVEGGPGAELPPPAPAPAGTGTAP